MSGIRRKMLLGAGSLVLGLPLLATSTAVADDRDERKLEAEMDPVPHTAVWVDADGEAEIEVNGVRVEVEIDMEDVAPNLPHLAHIHGNLDAPNECPTPAHDADGNGLISVREGAVTAPDGALGYGPVQVALTRSGDVSAASGGALDRMPLADEDGEIDYERDFQLPTAATGQSSRELAKALANLHVVVHGVDLNGNGVYDAGPVDGDPSDDEVALPAACGTLSAHH